MCDSEQNHDLDFGIAQFRHLRGQCKFPWLLANVLDRDLGEDTALANCDKTCMLESSNGVKIGVIGLGEREWYDAYFLQDIRERIMVLIPS